jgi:HEAT repeat protein
MVLALDRAFAMLPGRYGPELIRVAETDPDDRVRAFSTRVLGKLKNVELADVFMRLLNDRSPFVRQNAAWALGELAPLPRGRETAGAAYGDLRRVEEGDPASDVRAAATMALKRLQ